MTDSVDVVIETVTVDAVVEMAVVDVIGVSEVGPRGPQGPPGGVLPDVHVGTWSSVTFLHAFPFLPSVRAIEDVTNNEVTVNPNYPDATHVSLQFPQPFTGTILLGA